MPACWSARTSCQEIGVSRSSPRILKVLMCCVCKMESRRRTYGDEASTRVFSFGIVVVFLSVFLFFARENTIFLRVLCHSLGFAWFFLGKTLFLYGFRVISLGFFCFSYRQHYFPTASVLFSLGFWVFRKEKTHYFPTASVSFP